jgi:oligopeptidase A
MEAWDVAYVSEKLLQARYAFSEQEVKQYFTEDKVLAGLITVIEKLFGVRIQPDAAPLWHEDVRFYRIENPAGELIGQFYLDLYARETKRGGAWMDEAISRRRCHSSQPTADQRRHPEAGRLPQLQLFPTSRRPGWRLRPATFTHDEVSTLFHETGHGLHHLLTQVDEIGRRRHSWRRMGCRRAAVAVHGELLLGVARPAGNERPYRHRRKPCRARCSTRCWQRGTSRAACRPCGRWSSRCSTCCCTATSIPPASAACSNLLAEVRREVAVLVPPEWHRFPNSFSHIFAGGYAAGYYSYKWAEVLSADCYGAFEEAGNPFDQATGQRFLQRNPGGWRQPFGDRQLPCLPWPRAAGRRPAAPLWHDQGVRHRGPDQACSLRPHGALAAPPPSCC